MTVSEKIVESTLLQAVARVAMVLTLPLFVATVSYIGGSISSLGTTLAAHSTDIALLQQQAAATSRRQDQSEETTKAILEALQKLSIDMATTKTDAGYLRDWVEAVKREAKN